MYKMVLDLFGVKIGGNKGFNISDFKSSYSVYNISKKAYCEALGFETGKVRKIYMKDDKTIVLEVENE